MGKKGSSPQMPDPIDPGQAMGEYLFGKDFTKYNGVTDPRLQEKLLAAEATYRPKYTALELADINTMMYGIEGGEQIINPEYEGIQKQLDELKQLRATPSDTSAMQRYFEATKPVFSTQTYGRMPGNTQQYAKDLREWEALKSSVLGGESDAFDTAHLDSRIQELEDRLGSTQQYIESEGTKGLFDMLVEQSQMAGDLQREQLQLQREADVAALKEFAPQVVQAYRDADPWSTEMADLQQDQAKTLYEQSKGLTPEQRRISDQQARIASAARGRILDESSVASEILGREASLANKRAEARQAGALAFQQDRAMAGDIGSVLLGRPAQSIGLGQSVLQQAQAGAAGPMGPQLFDPNVGINMALQQQQNQVAYQGAMASADASRSGGFFGALGAVGGGLLGNVGLFN